MILVYSACVIQMSSEPLAVGGGAVRKGSSHSAVSENGNLDSAGGVDQIAVVRIGEAHIAEGKTKDGATEYYEVVEYSVLPQEEVVFEEEEDDVFVIEYSNPEEEGESYKFTMSMDRSLPAKQPTVRHPVVMSRRPRHEARRKLTSEVEVKQTEVLSNKSVLELGETYSDVMEGNKAADKQLVCSLCPPPGRFFKRGSGLAVHLKQVHQMSEKKMHFCRSCQQTVRSQLQLDTHTRRHAKQEAVFTCSLCSADKQEGFRGSKWGLRVHLSKEHPGVVPHCHICNKSFRTLTSYLSDQFRHVGTTPYYCAKCQIFEMTERGLSIHMRNHNRKKTPTQLQMAAVDNAATDESDL